jgi:hypothetical protein
MVKAKAVDYFKTISIPGVSKIVTTESYLFKLLWTALILFIFGFGFENISEAVADFYKYDKITNIERVNPENVTFPAITICSDGGYRRNHYKNRFLINSDTVNSISIKQFLNFEFTNFYKFKNSRDYKLENHLDFFKITKPEYAITYDCLRFNAVTNRSVELLKASSTEDSIQISLNIFYRENIFNNIYFNYSFIRNYLNVLIGDSSLNSFENLQFLKLDINNNHIIKIEKESIEIKLPEPYNPCQKSSVDKHYHQWNCIESCTYKEIKNKYNCTFHSTLFSIQGLRQCMLDAMLLKTEFSVKCLKECPLESCHSEKFTQQIRTENRNGQTLFHFSFRDLSTLNITQIPKTDGFTFLNNIGGGLGLFMGIAFPNLIEFLQFILEIVFIVFIQKIN